MLNSIKKLIAEIKNVHNDEFDKQYCSEKNFTAKEISKENFKEFIPEFTGKKIAFVDGGNLKILSGANFSILFNRVYYCIFENNKRIKVEKNKAEFFSLTYSKEKNNEILYTTKLFPINEFTREILPNEEDLEINVKDETIAIKERIASLNGVEGSARIFAEWNLTKKAIENLNEGDILVRDGSLQTGVKNEGNYALDVYSLAISKKVILLGVSKTCTLLTERGYSLIAMVNYFAEKNNFGKEWYCEDVFEIEEKIPIDLNFVKFNRNSKYIFRVENLNAQKENKEIAIKNLANESKEKAFAGYPYGLIDADKNARVRKKEIEMIKPLVLSEIAKNKNWKDIEILINSVNAHDVLDSVIGE